MWTTLQRSRSSTGIAYHRAGCGSPIVLVHGVGLRAESWYQQIKAFEATHRIFAVDLPGHGESAAIGVARPELAYFTDRLAAFVDEIIGGPTIVAGHSMGALVAFDFASRFPALCCGVAGLSVIFHRTAEARAAVQDRAKYLRERAGNDIASAPVRRWFGEPPSADDRDMAELCRSWLIKADPVGYAAAYTVFANENGPSDESLASLSVPALLLTGGSDKNSLPEMSHAMAALITNGDSVVVENGRHLVQLTHADEVNIAIGRFIEVCDQAQAGKRTCTGQN